MEMEKVPAAGYAIEGLWISGFSRSFEMRNFLFPIKLLSSFFHSASIVKKFKPHVAIGTGGFASGPALNAAIRNHVPVVIQEQNSYPGITNKILAKKAKRICVAYDGMEKYFPAQKIVKTGNPVRRNIVLCNVRPEKARRDFELSSSERILLVVGGSLGSRTLNNCMIAGIEKISNSGVQVIWQTGTTMFEQCRNAARKFSNVRVVDFIPNIDHAYATADVIISRAGAIAISELCLVGKPVILVPFPYAAEDHQTKNAMYLVKQNAAVHVSDKDALGMLINEALKLMADENKRTTLCENIKRFAIPDAAERIVDEVEKLVSGSE